MSAFTNEIDALSLQQRLANAGDRPVLVDVRTPGEWLSGCLPDALRLPLADLPDTIATLLPAIHTPVVVYCAHGQRSRLAAEQLHALGYTIVSSLKGGIAAWQSHGLPCTQETTLAPVDAQRYQRHLLLPEVGEAGQHKLLAAKVLIVGAGGLGSPVAMYLAAAGVGEIGLIDDDVVDLSNLQRQLLHGEMDVGRLKVDSAQASLQRLNSRVRVQPVAQRLDADNAVSLIEPYDIVVDCTDNLRSRYLISDVCLALNKPQVHGAIFRFQGQATVFMPGKGPCYRCLFPQAPPVGLSPACDTAGVLGVLPGILGTIQATETIKLILGIGQSLVGRLLCCDALTMQFTQVLTPRDPACPSCAHLITP